MRYWSSVGSLFFLIAVSVTIIACGGSERAPATENTAAGTPTPVAVQSGPPFSQSLELHGIRFVVKSPNSGSDNKVTVTPSGLEITNEGFTKSVDGEVYGAEIGDLNVDRSPEVYIYVRQRGGNKRVSLIAYSANNRKSLSEVYLPDLDPQSKDAAGYKGEDEFAVVENTLARRFPIYDGTGANAKKTGKTRQFQYKLKQGEAGWVLSVDKVVEY